MSRFWRGWRSYRTHIANKPQPDRAAFPGFRQIGESGSWDSQYSHKDGIYFVDSFGIKQKEIGLYLIEQFIDDNTIRLRNSQENLKIYQKINWLQQYFCEKHREMIDAQKSETYECQGSCAKIPQ